MWRHLQAATGVPVSSAELLRSNKNPVCFVVLQDFGIFLCLLYHFLYVDEVCKPNILKANIYKQNSGTLMAKSCIIFSKTFGCRPHAKCVANI